MGSTNTIITLDSMLFVYLLEDFYPLHEKTRQLFKLWETQQTPLLTSVISVLETLSSPKLIPFSEQITNYSRFFTSLPNLIIQPITLELSLQAAALRRMYPTLHSPDTIQITTAILNKSEIFITNDKNLLKLPIPNLKILSPIDL